MKGADWFVNCAVAWEAARARKPAMNEAFILIGDLIGDMRTSVRILAWIKRDSMILQETQRT